MHYQSIERGGIKQNTNDESYIKKFLRHILNAPKPEPQTRQIIVNAHPPIDFNPTLRDWRAYHCHRFGYQIHQRQGQRCGVRRAKKGITKPTHLQCIQADGNCFFRAISAELTGGLNEDYHADLRQKTIDIMREFEDRFSALIGKPVDDYIEQTSMDQDTTWSTDHEINAMAVLLQTPIVVYTLPDGTMTCHFLTFKPLCRVNNVERFGEQCIYLCLLNNHYERILS